MKTKFFLCTICGNVVVKTVDSGANLSCCGMEMMELIPGTIEGVKEKHLPVVECKDGTVKVKIGSVPHPMTEAHHIIFIYLETERGGQIQYLKKDHPAEAIFHVCKDKPVAVYAYCNIHGLWLTVVDSEDCL